MATATFVTLPVVVSMIETLLSFGFVTYTRLPVAFTATQNRLFPAGIVPNTLFVEVSITDIVPALNIARYANGPYQTQAGGAESKTSGSKRDENRRQS